MALLALVAGPATAAGPATRGFLSANSRVDGYTLADLATSWNSWAYSTPADVNPLLAVRCEASPIDSKIWFLPVSLGGEYTSTCAVPAGASLVLTPGNYECSTVEAAPFHGDNEAELRDCVQAGFELLTFASVSIDGRTTSDLADYAVTSHIATLPADNLLSPDSGQTMTKGYFLVIPPLGPGPHTVRAYDEFPAFDFQAGITISIVVSANS